MAPSKKNSTKNVGLLNMGLVLACTIGTVLSYYTYSIKLAKEKDENYEALCDISEHVSCSKAFMSEYGNGFGLISPTSIFYVPNALYGLAFYALVALLSICNQRTVTLFTVILGILSNLLTIYLAYILYLLNDICVVCVSAYIVNAAIGTLAIKKYYRLTARNGTQKKKKH